MASRSIATPSGRSLLVGAAGGAPGEERDHHDRAVTGRRTAPVHHEAIGGVLASVSVCVLAEVGPVFLGEDLLPLLVLAFGAAMAIGSALALVRPPVKRQEGDLSEASVGRSLVFVVIGTVAAMWAVASLLSS